MDENVFDGFAMTDIARTELERRVRIAIRGAILVEREAVLDAANYYMTQQYGIGALGHPVDRQRVIEFRELGLKRQTSPAQEQTSEKSSRTR